MLAYKDAITGVSQITKHRAQGAHATIIVMHITVRYRMQPVPLREFPPAVHYRSRLEVVPRPHGRHRSSSHLRWRGQNNSTVSLAQRSIEMISRMLVFAFGTRKRSCGRP